MVTAATKLQWRIRSRYELFRKRCVLSTRIGKPIPFLLNTHTCILFCILNVCVYCICMHIVNCEAKLSDEISMIQGYSAVTAAAAVFLYMRCANGTHIFGVCVLLPLNRKMLLYGSVGHHRLYFQYTIHFVPSSCMKHFCIKIRARGTGFATTHMTAPKLTQNEPCVHCRL